MSRKSIIITGLIALAALTGFYSLHSMKVNAPAPMLYFSVGDNYKKQWDKVDSLEYEGLVKSALQAVELIYKKAKADNNAPQVVRALIYRMKYTMNVEEEAQVKIIIDLKKEIKEAKFPVKPVLQSMLADMYWQYYANNRYRFSNRTETVNFDQDDIKTWDLRKLVQEVIVLYKASIENADSLKRTELNIYDEILTIRGGSKVFRPTLYDFLAHRALNFFISDRTYLTQPAYKFELTSENVFNPAGDFVKVKYLSKDTPRKFYR